MRDELVGHLREQLRFLRNSAEAYDQGFEAEAKRLAGVLRTLLVDRGKQRALLTQLKVLALLDFMDTADSGASASLMSSALVLVESSQQPTAARYLAPLDDLSPPRMNAPKKFNPWWREHVAQTTTGERFSREDLILAAAQSEGGVHVDPHRHRIYQSLVAENGLGWFVSSDAGTVPVAGDALLCNVRQIAFEADRTLAEQLPAVLPELSAGF